MNYNFRLKINARSWLDIWLIISMILKGNQCISWIDIKIDKYELQFQVAATQTIMLHLLSGRKTKPQHQILLGHSGRVNCLSYPNNDHPRYDVAHLVSGYVFDKVHIFWDGQIIFKIFTLPRPTFVLCSASQKQGEDFAKFCGLLRIYEL